MPTKPSILIVDDEFGLAEMLREMLREFGYEVTLAINGKLALEIARNEAPRSRSWTIDSGSSGNSAVR